MRERRTELAVACLILATVALIEVGSAMSPDLWWQLESGDLVLSDGFPATDPITWTQGSRPWVIHGWLSHVLLAGLTAWLGIQSLPIIFAVVLGLAWTALFVAAPGNPFGRAVVTLLAAAAAAPLTSPDSRTVSLVLMASTVAVVELVARGRWPRATAWAIVPLWLLWVNVDTWFLPGVVYVVLRALGVRLARERSDELSDRMGAVIGAGAVGLVSTLINPDGIGAWRAGAERLIGGPRSLVADLQSPDFQLSTVWPWVLLVGVVVLSMAFKSRLGLSELLVFFGFLLAGMMSYEYVAAHAIASVAVGSRVLAVGRSDRAPVSAVVVLSGAVAAWAVVVGAGSVDTWRASDPDTYPVAAMNFVSEAGLDDARVFNELVWGGYLARRGLMPFSDTRFDFHDDAFLADAVGAMNLLPAWTAIDLEYQPNLVVIRADRGLATYLGEIDGWSEVYRDDVARVFQRGDQP